MFRWIMYHHSKSICCWKAADTTLGKNPDDGLYFGYCSLSGLFVSGSSCLPYHNKLLVELSPSILQRHSAVEDKFLRCRLLIYVEVANTLEL